MDEIFAVGDLHGEYEKLETLLREWKSDRQQLVFLGDYVDRGPQSRHVISLIYQLYRKYGAVVLKGNHEDLFLDWLDDPEDLWFSRWVENESLVSDHEEMQLSTSVHYYSGGGDRTINSFYEENCAYRYLPSRHVKHIYGHFPEEISFLRQLPNYYEWNGFIFAHAGIDFNKENWKNTNDEDYRWLNRQMFRSARNDTGKIVVIGHQRTCHLNADKSDQIWISPCKTKIGIDGSAVFGGLLHGVVFSKNSLTPIEYYSVDRSLTTTHQFLR